MTARDEGERSEQFAIRLRTVRVSRKITQTHLAEITGCSQNAISSWERGIYPNAAALVSVCKALEVSADYLLGLCDHETGLPAGLFILDEEAVAQQKSGEPFAFQIPLRPRVATFAEVQDLYKKLL